MTDHDLEHVPASLGIDDEGLTLPMSLDPGATYDVLINGAHVWSFQPDRDTRHHRSGLVASWPRMLQRHLAGVADVVVVEHLGGSPVAVGRFVFGGDSSRTVSVTDRAGNPLVLDKYNKLIRPLSSEDGAGLDDILDQLERLMRDLDERAGVASFVCYGTLLGAVRDGRMIGHDNDVDIAYLSEEAYPVDVVREGFRVERALAEAGWTVRRGSGTRLNVWFPLADGSTRFVDVFTAHWVDGTFYMPSDTGFDLPRETVLPLASVELHGRRLPAPADPERLLAATYGPSWRTPDPSFKYETPRWLSRRFNGWFGGLRTDRKLWDAFYGSSQSRVPRAPTAFALWVHREYPSRRPLVDLGCGNARDARWFARPKRGRSVTAIDYALGMMTRTSTVQKPLRRVRREVLNLNDLRPVLSLGTRLSRKRRPVDLYGRFLLHALDEQGRDNVLRLASMSLRRGGYLFLEFRTHLDRHEPHVFKHPHRRFLDPDDVVASIESAGGRVVRREEGHGLAVFEDEDPHVCRLVATWSD